MLRHCTGCSVLQGSLLDHFCAVVSTRRAHHVAPVAVGVWYLGRMRYFCMWIVQLNSMEIEVRALPEPTRTQLGDKIRTYRQTLSACPRCQTPSPSPPRSCVLRGEPSVSFLRLFRAVWRNIATDGVTSELAKAKTNSQRRSLLGPGGSWSARPSCTLRCPLATPDVHSLVF